MLGPYARIGHFSFYRLFRRIKKMVEIPEKWFAIVNPTSGGGRGLDDWPLISKLLREWHIIPDYAFTEYRHHAAELLVQALADGYRKIMIVGGDGTIHEVMNGLFVQQTVPVEAVTVGVIVVGSENTRERIYGVSYKYSESVRTIASGFTRKQKINKLVYHDAHYRQERYMALEAHVGFETYVKRRYNRLRETGKHKPWHRMRSLQRALFRYRATGMKIWVDGVLEVNDLVYGAEIQAVHAGTGNASKYINVNLDKGSSKSKGHMEYSASAIAGNGEGSLKLAVIKRVRLMNVLFHLRALYYGDLYKLNEVEYYYGRHIRIESSPETGVDSDGEIMGFSPTEFMVEEKSINLVVNRR